MATNESSFKVEFRKALLNHYGSSTEIWTTNDMFRSGVPDFNATWGGKYFSIEAKFVTKVAKKDTSKALTHELTELQYKHLMRMHETGSFGVVLVGFKDVAVVVPIYLWPAGELNISLGYLKSFREKGLVFFKCPHWSVEGFFERLSNGG